MQDNSNKVDLREWRREGRTCDVDISWGGVQGGGCPCSAAVGGSDAFDSGESFR